MSLRDALKRAASLVVEFEPEDAPSPSSNAERAASSSPSSTDQMWAELENATKYVPGAAASTAPVVEAQASPPSPRSTVVKSVEDIVRDAAGPNLDQISVTGSELPELVGPDGQPAFAPIYSKAGLPPVSYSAEQMLEMLTSLPAELPLNTRRQTVNAMLKGMGTAIGASPETIVADASRKLAALAAYVDASSRKGSEKVSACETEILQYEAKIAEHRNTIAAEKASQLKVSEICTQQAGQLHQVLEFFSVSPAVADASKT